MKREKIIEKLQDLVYRNYLENFAFQKVLRYPQPEKEVLSQRLRDLLDRSPNVVLREQVSIVISEILQLLSIDQKEYAQKMASHFQLKHKGSISYLASCIEEYQITRKAESGGVFSGILSSFSHLGQLASKCLNHEKQPSHKTHQGKEYSQLEMEEKKKL